MYVEGSLYVLSRGGGGVYVCNYRPFSSRELRMTGAVM